MIRNTVRRAQKTFAACDAARPDLLPAVDGQLTLHHNRFAAEDRATQTLEQSLDLCADLPITSRNHDLKREIAFEAASQDWLFALVSPQTMEGFGVAGNAALPG
ncbi:hypothetical protein [Rhodovulum kholense]|uniref:Uncharacterized protein n=1 Tax=Rhodovulum kholense TaxID=453584 RepID=A0A8E3AS48_9RHOB|nr:hypothetical protein [Rhodovulum kholense]PTW51812.1 hypothetical protein C8N38_101115 [Rhodovulum kholense]